MVVSKVLYFFISVFNSLLTLHFFNDVHVSIIIQYLFSIMTTSTTSLLKDNYTLSIDIHI